MSSPRSNPPKSPARSDRSRSPRREESRSPILENSRSPRLQNQPSSSSNANGTEEQVDSGITAEAERRKTDEALADLFDDPIDRKLDEEFFLQEENESGLIPTIQIQQPKDDFQVPPSGLMIPTSGPPATASTSGQPGSPGRHPSAPGSPARSKPGSPARTPGQSPRAGHTAAVSSTAVPMEDDPFTGVEPMDVDGEAGADVEALAEGSGEPVEEPSVPPISKDIYYMIDQGTGAKFKFSLRYEDGTPKWMSVQEHFGFYKVSIESLTEIGSAADLIPPKVEGGENDGKQVLHLYSMEGLDSADPNSWPENPEIALTVMPDPMKVMLETPVGDRVYEKTEDMFEDDRIMLEKRFKQIQAKEIKEWIKALCLDGHKQNQLFSNKRAMFKKRFNIDTPGVKGSSTTTTLPDGTTKTTEVAEVPPMNYPHCKEFLIHSFCTFCQDQEPISRFLLDFETGSAKSFVVVINQEAWTHYLKSVNLWDRAQNTRLEATVKDVLAELHKREYDSGFIHWKKALGNIRKLSTLNFSLDMFVKLKVGAEVLPYKKHSDRQVVNAASEFLKKYKKLHDERKGTTPPPQASK